MNLVILKDVRLNDDEKNVLHQQHPCPIKKTKYFSRYQFVYLKLSRMVRKLGIILVINVRTIVI